MSTAVGVGRSTSASDALKFLGPPDGRPRLLSATGVGSTGDDEDSFPAVRGTRVGRSYNTPFRIEPQRGKVGEDGVEPKSKVPCDVLKHRDPGS
jgi:hypothetical protein